MGGIEEEEGMNLEGRRREISDERGKRKMRRAAVSHSL